MSDLVKAIKGLPYVHRQVRGRGRERAREKHRERRTCDLSLKLHRIILAKVPTAGSLVSCTIMPVRPSSKSASCSHIILVSRFTACCRPVSHSNSSRRPVPLRFPLVFPGQPYAAAHHRLRRRRRRSRRFHHSTPPASSLGLPSTSAVFPLCRLPLIPT